MSYPKETKIALVREYEQGKTVAEVSKASGVPENSIYRYQYRGINDFRKSVDSYIEYNNGRRVHSFLGYLSPTQFETKDSGKNDNDRSI